MPADGYYRISEISAQFGVSYRTLRLYEERELITPDRVGYSRYYTDKDKARLELILKAKKLGFSLSEIWQLIDASPKANSDAFMSKDEILRRLETLESKRAAVERSLTELNAALAERSR